MRDLMWWARWLVVAAIICAVVIFIFTTSTNYQSYKNSSTASEIAADDFYSFSILDSPEEKQILQDQKSSLQRMTTRKRNTMNHDMAMQGGVILGLSAAWGILIFAKRAEQSTNFSRRVRKSALYGNAEAKTEQQEELHMQ